jgi:hypothetical protein
MSLEVGVVGDGTIIPPCIVCQLSGFPNQRVCIVQKMFPFRALRESHAVSVTSCMYVQLQTMLASGVGVPREESSKFGSYA